MPDGLDPTISLQAGRNIPQFGPDVGQVLSLARLGMAVQQQQQQQQSLAALRQAYANPANFQGGMPTMAAISQAGQQSPEAAMELQKFGAEGARTQYLQQQMESARQQLGQRWNKALMTTKQDAQDTYQTALANGSPEPEARAAAQRVYTAGVQQELDTGEIPASQARMISPNFDPRANAQHLENYKKVQDYLTAQKKEGREEQSASREGFGDAGNYVGSNTGGQPVFAQLNKDTGRIEQPGGQVVENAKKVSSASPNPKVQAFDAYMREHPNATAEDQANFIKSTGGAGRGGAAQIQRLVGASNEAVASLQNLVDLPISATAGWFQGLQNETAESLGGAIHRTIANKLTGQDAQDIATTFTGLQRTLAVIDAQGSAYGVVGLSKQMQALMPREGDSSITVLRKYAEMRQILDQGIESITSSPDTAKSQVKLLDDVKAKVAEAVPWTVKDVTDLERSKKKGLFSESVSPESAKEFAEKILKGRQQAGGGIPEEARSKLQEGHVTTFANGQKWTLKNGQPERVP